MDGKEGADWSVALIIVISLMRLKIYSMPWQIEILVTNVSCQNPVSIVINTSCKEYRHPTTTPTIATLQ